MDYQKYINSFLDSKKAENDKKYGRNASWNIVYEDFLGGKDSDYLARSLTIYLASWGMMRGSSELLKTYNYKIHIKAVEIILESLEKLRKYPEDDSNEINKYVDEVVRVIEKLKEYYQKKNVSPTDTLITKILLGTSASTPAFDQYFKKFLSKNNISQVLNKKSLVDIWKLYFINKEKFQVKDYDYPPMKKIDMAGFQYGLEIEEAKKRG